MARCRPISFTHAGRRLQVNQIERFAGHGILSSTASDRVGRRQIQVRCRVMTMTMVKKDQSCRLPFDVGEITCAANLGSVGVQASFQILIDKNLNCFTCHTCSARVIAARTKKPKFMADKSIEEKVKDIIVEQLGVNPRTGHAAGFINRRFGGGLTRHCRACNGVRGGIFRWKIR